MNKPSLDGIVERNLTETKVMNDLWDEARKHFEGLSKPLGRQEFMGVHYIQLYAERFDRYYKGEGHRPTFDLEEYRTFLTGLYDVQDLLRLQYIGDRT